MRSTLILLAFLLLSGAGAWGQDPGNCVDNGTLELSSQRCSCTGAMVQVNKCVSDFKGIGCMDAGTTQLCGSTCGFLAATGCIGRGPKLELPLISEMKNEFTTGPQLAVVTCRDDHGAFQRWLLKTSSVRLVRPLTVIGE